MLFTEHIITAYEEAQVWAVHLGATSRLKKAWPHEVSLRLLKTWHLGQCYLSWLMDSREMAFSSPLCLPCRHRAAVNCFFLSPRVHLGLWARPWDQCCVIILAVLVAGYKIKESPQSKPIAGNGPLPWCSAWQMEAKSNAMGVFLNVGYAQHGGDWKQPVQSS